MNDAVANAVDRPSEWYLSRLPWKPFWTFWGLVVIVFSLQRIGSAWMLGRPFHWRWELGLIVLTVLLQAAVCLIAFHVAWRMPFGRALTRIEVVQCALIGLVTVVCYRLVINEATRRLAGAKIAPTFVDWYSWVHPLFVMFVALVLAGRAIAYMHRVLEQQRISVELEAQIAEAQLYSVRTRMDFASIFRAFDEIEEALPADPERASERLNDLADSLRKRLLDNGSLLKQAGEPT